MSKVSTKPKTYGIHDSYRYYVQQLLKEVPELKGKRHAGIANGIILSPDGTEYITFKMYKNILGLYYMKMGVKLIHGYAFELHAGLGNIFIMRQERDHSLKPRVNRGESFKLRAKLKKENKELVDWKVVYTDEEFVRTTWMKPKYVKNITFYKFSPANGKPGKGFKQLMSRTINSNKQLLALYPLVSNK